jgi:hypothetical protein
MRGGGVVGRKISIPVINCFIFRQLVCTICPTEAPELSDKANKVSPDLTV